MMRMNRYQTGMTLSGLQVSSVNLVKSEQSFQLPKPQPAPMPHLHHALLAIEVTRLREVVSQYEENLQNLSKDVEELQEENDELHDDNLRLRNELAEARQKLAVPPPPPPPPQPTVVKTIYVQEPAPMPQVIHQPAVLPPPPIPQPQPTTATDLLNDDKSALVNMLVKKNIENDHLRRELEYYKVRSEGVPVDRPRPSNLAGDPSKTGDLLRAVGDLMSKYRYVDPETEQNAAKAMQLAYKLAANLEQKPRPSTMDASFGPDGILAELRDLQTPSISPDNYNAQRKEFLNAIGNLQSRLAAGPKPNNEAVRRLEPGSPLNEKLPQEEFRTEIINGVPTRVRVVRRVVDPGVSPRPFAGEITPSPQSNELAAALRRISELERQAAILQGQADLQNLPAFGKEIGDLTVTLVQRDLQDWRLKAAALESELQMANRELNTEQGRAKRLETERDDLEHRLRVFEGLYDETKAALDKVKSQLREYQDQERSVARRAAELRDQAEFKTRELDTVKEELADKKGRVAELEARNRALADEVTEFKQRARLAESELDIRKDAANQLSNSVQDRDREIKRLKDELNKANEDIAEMDNTFVIMKNKLQDKQIQAEAATAKEKEMAGKLTDCLDVNRKLEDKNKELQKSVDSSKAAYKDKLRKTRAALGAINEQVKNLKSGLKTCRSACAKDTIDYKKAFQVLATVLTTQGEFNPRGTLRGLIDAKARLNEETRSLNLRTEDFEAMLRRKDEEIRNLVAERDSEVNSLESRLEAMRQEKLASDGIRSEIDSHRHDDVDKLKRRIKVLEDDLENAVNETARLKKDHDRKEREIADLRDDLDAEIRRCDDLKKSLKRAQSHYEITEFDPRKGSPAKTQEFTIRSVNDNRTPVSHSKGVQLFVDQKDGDGPTEVDIFIDTSDFKPARTTVETRPTVAKPVHREQPKSTLEDTVRLEKQLDEAKATIRHYEQQLALMGSKDRQRETITARLAQVEANLMQLQAILKNKDLEIERLKGQPPSLRSSTSSLPQDEQDRIEVLRQRTEAMLAKLEKRLETTVAKSGGNQNPELDTFVREVQTLRRRLNDANKKYVNEYISVCQRSLDIYEKL